MVAVADLCVCGPRWPMHFDEVVNSEAIAFTVFYIFTALATTWYYRGILRRSVADVVLVGIFPLGGAAVLTWVLAKSIPALGPTARWTVAGVGILGVVLMGVSAWVLRAPFFNDRGRPGRTRRPRQQDDVGPPARGRHGGGRGGVDPPNQLTRVVARAASSVRSP